METLTIHHRGIVILAIDHINSVISYRKEFYFNSLAFPV